MTKWEMDWYENYKSPQYNPISGQWEMMSMNEYIRNKYQEKARCISVLSEIRDKIKKYEQWKVTMGPGATYIDGKVNLLKEDLASWEDYSARIFASAPGEFVWFDPKFPRHFYFG